MSEFKLKQSLDLRQSQNLVMTPQMQQAVKILQLSNIELQDYLEEQLALNPLLEKDERPAEGEGEAEEVMPEPTKPDTGDDDFDAGSRSADMGKGGSVSFEDDDNNFEDRLVRLPSLRDHLMQQLMMQTSDRLDKSIGALLIDRLDDAGYMREDVSALAASIGVSGERALAVLELLQGFDPPGIFARDLAECLRLQLLDRDTLDAPMEKLLQHLALAGKHDYVALAQICDVHDSVVREMLGELKTLNPRPSSSFEHVVVQTALPDVLMRKMPASMGGGWKVELNTETLPRVLVNNDYYTFVNDKAKDKGEREYLTTQLNNANWLVRALDQRAQTILKVASEIVEAQEGFFLYGIEYLKPLTLREVAEKTAVHESTVSRVTAGKYIGTPRGIFELRFFFTSAIEGADGQSHSSEAVKAKIKSAIDAETKVLSDDELVDAMKAEGIDIARRTVAKYREAMNIPSSVQRRRLKGLK